MTPKPYNKYDLGARIERAITMPGLTEISQRQYKLFPAIGEYYVYEARYFCFDGTAWVEFSTPKPNESDNY